MEDVDERQFLVEAAWVVLSSGMRESVIRRIFPAIEDAFGGWQEPKWVVQNAAECKARASGSFGHSRKLDAVVEITRIVATNGLDGLLADVRRVCPDALCGLPYMGPATSRHLAKNLGVDVAKPDRHLVRVAEAVGYDSPALLCGEIADAHRGHGCGRRSRHLAFCDALR